MAKKTASKDAQPTEGAPVIAYKGFDQKLACRGFQYEIGTSYRHEGEVEACESGFHACEHPLNVFAYYPPATSRYAEVELSGALSRHGDDTKIAAAEITIKAELKIPELVERAVKWVFDRAKWVDGPVASGGNEAATASGDQGAATASGRWGAATASGYQGAATASGDQGAATASHPTATAHASNNGRVSGVAGSSLHLDERDDDGKILNAWGGVVGRDGIEPDTFYRLVDGKPVKVED